MLVQANSTVARVQAHRSQRLVCVPASQLARSVVSASRLPLSRKSAAWQGATRATEETASPSPADTPAPAPAVGTEVEATPEEVFYEGPGSNAELAVSLILMPTLIYAPLSIASIGRRLWITFKFTNKRLVITNTSPLFKRTIEVAYKNIKEIRTAPRGFGLWGDMVVFLRDGSRLEITGIEKYKEIADYINRQNYTL
ncbi:hypothetical protein HYH02_004956 [Chlamydomonas schloesseri]|uniref:YdbS-like PH domain-containing protein n=1 Tax=Chlamydomonas schloesseri TaxID=2026947 RepID=A0A835WNF6_9CHLO|nr:hypothetical protein HYH02_004956 [Chlamydomonas schloesseri]|eukprot:KAG2450454.1 hypothetical protein HYH02_004956 [Chlamydomonas schloesseri]